MTQKEKYDIIRRCPLFEGYEDGELSSALTFFGAEEEHYLRGDVVLRMDEPVTRFALVVSGCVQVLSDDMEGSRVIMNTVLPGQTFGESLCYRRVSHSPVQAEAFAATTLIWLRADVFSGGHCEQCNAFITMLTMKTLAMNDRIQVLSKLTLRKKLITLFSQYASREGTSFTLPFDRDTLAEYLGTNRSALSRELSKMQAEGIIEIKKSQVKLLKNEE